MTSNKYIMGIDPGKNGAVAFISKLDLKDSFVYDFESENNVVQLIREYKDRILISSLELVHSMPKQGVKSMFSFGQNYGFYQGILQAFSIPFQLIRPQEWKNGLVPRNSAKSVSCEIASRLFPEVELKGKRGGFKDGRADALLIAYHLLLKLQGGMHE